MIAKHVQARYRPRERGFHERVYLWDEGGLSIGGSPTTFGQGHVRMTRIRPSEAAIWRQGLRPFGTRLFSARSQDELPRANLRAEHVEAALFGVRTVVTRLAEY